MNKHKILEIVDRHSKLFRAVFSVINKFPFNNSWGGSKI